MTVRVPRSFAGLACLKTAVDLNWTILPGRQNWQAVSPATILVGSADLTQLRTPTIDGSHFHLRTVMRNKATEKLDTE